MLMRAIQADTPVLLTLCFFVAVTAWAQLSVVPPLPLTVLSILSDPEARDGYFDHDRNAEYSRGFAGWCAVWGLPRSVSPAAQTVVGMVNLGLLGWVVFAPRPDSRVAACAAITVLHLFLLSSMLLAGSSGSAMPHITTLIETTTIEMLSGLHVLLSLRRRVELEERWPTAVQPAAGLNRGQRWSSGGVASVGGIGAARLRGGRGPGTIAVMVPFLLLGLGLTGADAHSAQIVRPPGAVGDGWLGGDALFTWCEPDTWAPAAEFHNTWSNIPYCLVGLITFHSASQTAALEPLRLVGLMLVTIGVGSMLFHGTLTRFGQAADELAILWWEVSMLLLLYPSRSLSIWVLFALETSVYWLMDLYPKVGWLLYHPAHSTVDLLVVYGVYVEAAATNQRDIQTLVKLGLGLIAVAGGAWGADFAYCDATQHLHLHAYGWHFFSCAAIATLHIALALILLRRHKMTELPTLFGKFKVD